MFKTRALYFLSACLLLTGCDKLMPLPFWTTGAEKPLPGTPMIVVAAGQSNMTGCHGGTAPINRNINVTIIGEGPWCQGPAYTFALNFNSKGYPVKLYQCAVGGSSMDSWSATGNLTNTCMNALKRDQITHIDALLFWQGEYESQNGASTYPWAQTFTGFVTSFRNEFNKDLPVVYAQLEAEYIGNQNPQDYDPARYQNVIHEQATVFIQHCQMISMSDIIGAYGVHLNQVQYTEAGNRFWRAFSTLN